jgi:hypothetical protein
VKSHNSNAREKTKHRNDEGRSTHPLDAEMVDIVEKCDILPDFHLSGELPLESRLEISYETKYGFQSQLRIRNSRASITSVKPLRRSSITGLFRLMRRAGSIDSGFINIHHRYTEPTANVIQPVSIGFRNSRLHQFINRPPGATPNRNAIVSCCRSSLSSGPHQFDRVQRDDGIHFAVFSSLILLISAAASSHKYQSAPPSESVDQGSPRVSATARRQRPVRRAPVARTLSSVSSPVRPRMCSLTFLEISHCFRDQIRYNR